MATASDGTLADRPGLLPLPALTFATGVILGVFAITGAGGLDNEAREPTRVARYVSPQIRAPDYGRASAPVGAAAPATGVSTPAFDLVYYIVGSPEEARSLGTMVNHVPVGEAHNGDHDTATEYRILLVETPTQEGAALAEIARAGTEHGGVSVIDLRAGASSP